MNPVRPLENCAVGLSISAGEDLQGRGLDLETVNRAVLQIAEVLLGAGANLVFGHDWRPGGVMQAIAGMAVRYHQRFSTGTEGPPRILNLVAPPDVPWVQRHEQESQVMRARLRGLVEARQIPFQGDAGRETGRANALSSLRRELTASCNTRICLGGTLDERTYKGWFPGILEEGVLALKAAQPVYAGSMFGGAAAQLVSALRQGQGSFQPRRFRGDAAHVEALTWASAPSVANGLDEEEQHLLSETDSLEQFTELCFRGLVRWWKEAQSQTRRYDRGTQAGA